MMKWQNVLVVKLNYIRAKQIKIMIINGVEIEDTFSEAFSMRATRIIITAINYKWARHAAETMTGFATSVIGCNVEAGIEKIIGNHETPDGRPGISVLLFATDKKTLEKQLQKRIGQCVLTCPTTAVFAGIEGEDQIELGKNLRFFGDGFQSSKMIGKKKNFYNFNNMIVREILPTLIRSCAVSSVTQYVRPYKVPTAVQSIPLNRSAMGPA